MTTWRCSHDPTHPLVEAVMHPMFCEARVALQMQCGARMEMVKEEDRDRIAPQPVPPTPPTPNREGTMSKLIQMSSGAPDITPGNYIVTLTNLTGPREATMPDGEVVNFFDWTFATEDGKEFEDSSTNKTGPKSKLRQWIAALLGRVPAKDEGFDPADLIGRMAVVTIEDRDGWPRIANMGVLMQPQAAPAVVPPPVVQPVAPPQPVVVAPPTIVQAAPELPLG